MAEVRRFDGPIIGPERDGMVCVGEPNGSGVTPQSLTGSGGGFDGVILRPRPIETRPVILMTPATWTKSQWESLGTAETVLNRRWAGNKDTLDSPIPASGSLDRFDDIKVVYHRPAALSQKSARIAVESFVITRR